MYKTDTGGFGVGFRRFGFEEWCTDIDQAIAFAKDNGFASIDLAKDGAENGQKVLDAGVQIGSVDLPEWKDLANPDDAARQAAVEKNIAYIETCGAMGISKFFVVIQAGNPDATAKECFDAAVKGYAAMGDALEKVDGWVVIEGCPALVSTPETYRVFLKECHPRMAINYDPSHLVRMGIDHIRFLEEFAPYVKHIHGKDTEVSTEGLFEFGHQIAPVLTETPWCGNGHWRYTIPGQGCVRWRKMFQILEAAGYEGLVSIELEDHYFKERSKDGLIASGQFLKYC